MGDEFTTYDYIVRVTEVSGSETAGWTGKGELVMNFLKIGSSPVVEIPLAVEFNGINLNQCYQLLAGPKVITTFDPNWSNVVDVDNITDRLSDIYAEIKDLLAYDPGNTAALQTKVSELNSIKADLTSSDFTPVYITEQTTAVNGAIAAVSCYAAAPGARSTNSCTADDVVTALDGAQSAQNSSTCPYFGDVFNENGDPIETSPGGIFPRIIIKVGTKYIPINEWSVKNASKAEALSKIYLKYLGELNLSTSKLYTGRLSVQGGGAKLFNFADGAATEDPTGALWWAIPSKSMIVIYVEYINGSVGFIPSYINNAKSILYHEYLHLDGYDAKGDKTKEGIENHLKVYELQTKHPLFGLSTANFKREMISNYRNYVKKFESGDFKDRDLFLKWKNKFTAHGYEF